MREKLTTLAMSLGIGALMFGALAVVVRWLRFALLHSLPVVAVILVCAAPAHAQGKVFTVSEWAVLGAHALDASATQRCVGSGRCRELNPYLARFDQPVAFTGAKVGLAWVQLWAVRKIRPTHPRLATVTNYAIALGFGALAIRNERIGQ